MDRVCRWGILGTAGIARKNWKAIKLSGNSRVAAVASRRAGAAEQFIDECSSQVPVTDRPAAVSSYEALLGRDDIDAVYIPLPTALRHEWVIRAAEAGKHVIGEKPAALNASQVREMLQACQEHQVQYMDGVMFMHSGRMPIVRQLLDDGDSLGQLRRLYGQFSFAGDEEFGRANIRTDSRLEPHGCLGDLGWYLIRYFLWVMNGQLPTHVQGRSLSQLQGNESPHPVPGEFAADLYFDNGVSAGFYCSFRTENQQWIHASGSRGNLRIHDFVLPYHGSSIEAFVTQDAFVIDNCEFHMEHHETRHAIRERDAGAASAQEVCMIRNFANQVLSNHIDRTWPDWTLKTQVVLDACFQSAADDGAAVTVQL